MNGIGKVPGGCDDCDAYQTLERDPEHPNIMHLRVWHDDTCPFLNRHQR